MRWWKVLVLLVVSGLSSALGLAWSVWALGPPNAAGFLVLLLVLSGFATAAASGLPARDGPNVGGQSAAEGAGLKRPCSYISMCQ
jgi:hypothetical protein